MKPSSKRCASSCLVILILLLLQWQNARAQVSLDHEYGFKGAPSDGARPGVESSLTALGKTLFGVTLSGGVSNSGTLFMINSNLTGIQIIHSFLGKPGLFTSGQTNDGALPCGTPVLLNGVVYGTTVEGGSNGIGTVYSVNTNGSNFQVLHHFGGLNDGFAPYSSLVVVSNTTLYGMTSDGTNGITQGTIFSIDTSGNNYTVLHAFGPGGDPMGSLIVSGSILYGVTFWGGTNSEGSIFKINTDGSGYKELHSFNGTTNDAANPKGSLVISGSTLYGTASTASTNGYGAVFAINTDGSGLTFLHSFALNDTINPVGGLAIYGSTLLGMTYAGGDLFGEAGLGFGTVYRINTDATGYQIVHTFQGTETDGSTPLGPPVFVGKELYGMTSLGGSATDAGCIFALNPAGPGGAPSDTNPPSITMTYPTNNAHILPNPGMLFPGQIEAYGINTDNVAVAYAMISWDGLAYIRTYQQAPSTWYEPFVILKPGTNTVSVYAVDTAGNHSKTNTVTCQYVVDSVLTVITNGAGTITSSLNGQVLQEGLMYSMTAKADVGSVFVNWTDGHGNVITNSATIKFSMTANLTLVANFQDVTPPKLTITAPKTGSKTSNDVVTVTGTATDNVAVSNVVYSLNGSDLAKAGLTNTTWGVQVTLVPGTNTFTTYAIDTSGNHSTTNTIKLVYILSAQVTVDIVGQGTLKPNYNNAFLAISNHYVMVATAATGSSFYFWDVGGNMVDGTTLNFVMVSNLVITANFKDITAPKITITAPKAGAKDSNATVNVAGTASDNVGVTNVGVQINGNGWVDASGTTNWTADGLAIKSGTNTIQAYAMDAAGNISLTNTVKFVGVLPPDWAPTSIAGSSILVTPANGNPITASFDTTTFSQSDTNGPGDSGIGTYAYSQIHTNVADLSLTNTAPLNFNINLAQNIELDFTSLNAGSFTNVDSMDYGTFAIVPATNFIPAAWTSHTFTATNASQTVTTVKIDSTTQLTVTEGGSVTDPYTVTAASPLAAMFVVTDTLTGKLIYFQPTFTSKTGGYYEVNNYTNGVFEEGDTGTFGFK